MKVFFLFDIVLVLLLVIVFVLEEIDVVKWLLKMLLNVGLVFKNLRVFIFVSEGNLFGCVMVVCGLCCG